MVRVLLRNKLQRHCEYTSFKYTRELYTLFIYKIWCHKRLKNILSKINTICIKFSVCVYECMFADAMFIMHIKTCGSNMNGRWEAEGVVYH